MAFGTDSTQRRRRLATSVAVALLVTACGSGDGDGDSAGTADSTTPTSQAAGTQTDTTPDSTAPSSTATSPGTDAPSTTVSVPASAELPTDCSWRTPATDGSVSFVIGGQLYEVTGDGSVACLSDVRADETGPIRWSPDATRVLLGGSVEVGEFGRRPTGYFATNPDVTWSAPTGKALIAPSVDNGSLVWRNAADSSDRIDISFLTDTVAAAYHPAGKAIAALGTDETGSMGLYLATNRGEDRKQLTFAEDPADAALTELAFEADGTSVYFLHQHGSMFHVHQLIIDGVQLIDVADEEGTADHLVTSTTRDQDIAWQRTVGSSRSVQAIFAGGAPVTWTGDESTTALEPVGWWNDRLVILERAPGTPDDGTLWAWSGTGEPVRLATGVERAAVRVERGAFVELPDEITQQAVG